MISIRLTVGIKRSCPDISRKDSASNGGKSPGHDGVYLRQGQLVEVGLDDEGGCGLPEKDVGRSIERLACSRAWATLQCFNVGTN